MRSLLAVTVLLLVGCYTTTTTSPPQGPPVGDPAAPPPGDPAAPPPGDPAAPPPAPPVPPAPPPGYAEGVDLSTPLPCPVDPRQLGFNPVPWPSGSAPTRWGHGWTDIARVRTSKARPIEVCTVRGQLRWLMSLRCPDGTPPYTNPRVAYSSRAGNVGPGGRCGRVIDRYRVPCSDRVYEVYLDLYHCTPEGE